MYDISSISRGTPDMKPSRIHTASGTLNSVCASATAMGVSNKPTLEYSWKNGSKNTAGGDIRLDNSQKNRCLSPTNRKRENAYAAGSATAKDSAVFMSTYSSELT